MAYTRAVIDLGTNTFQLLVGSCTHANAPLQVLANLQRPVQLGKGAMESGIIQSEAVDRAQLVLAEFVLKACLDISNKMLKKYHREFKKKLS